MSSPVQPPLTVTTVGGSPSGRPITTIKVSTGDLTITGSTAVIDTSGSGGGGSVTSIATTAPITGGTITTTGTIGISQADGSTDGFLSSTDWNTFDAKQDTISLTTTGTSGAASLVGATLNIPNYTNSATIGGSIANTQVAYGSGANTIQGSANLTFDGSNLSVGGYVKTGGNISIGDAAGEIETDNATSLTFQTNSGTDSGKITLAQGADANIEIIPNGTGEVHLGNYKFDVDQTAGASEDNYVLTFNNASGLISLEESGGGSGTVTSVGLTETGSALTITGSPVTGSGTIDIAGAGTSSQVILGDLSLATLPTGTVDGSGSTQQVATWSDSDTLTGSTNLTFDGSNLFANLIKTQGTVTTLGTSDLTLNTNNGTNSGSIVITDGVDGKIAITPNGAGAIELDGLNWPTADGTANYVLKTDGGGNLSWTENTGGSTSPGGSDGELQYNNSGTFGGLDYVKRETTGGYEGLALGSAAPGLITTQGAYNLKLDTNTGTNSGVIEITDGVDGDISITPNGNGRVEISGAYKLPTVVTSDNDYVLTAQTDGSTAWAAAGGSTSPAGSNKEIQFNDSGSFGADAQLLWDSPNDTLQVGQGVGYPRLALAGNNGFVYFKNNAATPVTNASIGTNGTDLFLKSFPTDTERLRITTDGSWGIEGANYGTSGQVLTSGGSGASVSWTTVSAGGIQPFTPAHVGTGTFLASYNRYMIDAAPYGVSDYEDNAYTAYKDYPTSRPFSLAEGGTWGGVTIQVSSASTGNAIFIAIYDSDTTTGMPTALKGYCEVATTSTGIVTQTTTLDSTGSSASISLTANTQYWCAVVAKDGSDTFSLSTNKSESLSALGGNNVANTYNCLRNTFSANDVDTTNPPRNTQMTNVDFPRVGVII